MEATIIRIGTRKSALARWQTDYVAKMLQIAWPQLRIEITIFDTRGDQVLDAPLPLIGGKGLFTAELEQALYQGTIDLAVHSLKDLPTELPPGLIIGAIPPRVDPADVLVSRHCYTLATLPPGAVIGTSSRRRIAQLLQRRPDLRILDIRGNLDTRLRKALNPTGAYDAIVLAYAGLQRLDLTDTVSEMLAFDDMLPAPGQGALGVQCRDEFRARELLQPINDALTASAVTAERAFLQGLGGGCSMPIAAHAVVAGHMLHVRGRVSAPDGGSLIDLQRSVQLTDEPEANLLHAHQVGLELAHQALVAGADTLLEVML
jgi:hydroxymethylbilane synthase